MRVGLLRVYSMLINTVESGRLSSNSNVLDLIQTAVTISHILYSPPSKCTPRNVLRLYNMCWLFSPLSLGQIFLDCIIIHYRSMDLFSTKLSAFVVDTEANERMFNRVKVVADQCTNRHPEQNGNKTF